MKRVVIPALFLAAACSSSPAPNPDLAMMVTQPDLAMPPPPVTLAGSIRDPGTVPLEGVQACLHPAGTPCAMTDVSGYFEIPGVDGSKDGAVRLSKAGFVSDIFAFPGSSGEPASLAVILIPQSVLDAHLATAGKTQSGDKGMVLLNIFGATAPASGATGSLVGATADGPYYFDGTGAQAALTSSTAGGLNWLFNVPVGTQRVKIALSGTTCEARFAWKTSAADEFTVPVAAGDVTSLSVTCE